MKSLEFPLGVDGGNVCATCPTNCCGGCNSYFGYFRSHFFSLFYGTEGENQKIKEHYLQYKLRIPIEFQLIAALRKKSSLSTFYQNKQIQDLLAAAKKRLNTSFTFTPEKGFLTSNGCSLDRKYRSGTCLKYKCNILERALKSNRTHKTFQDVA